MKNSLFIIAAVLSLGACKKKIYTCECVTMPPGKQQFDIKAGSIKDAEKKCAAYTDKPELDGPYCYLKK